MLSDALTPDGAEVVVTRPDRLLKDIANEARSSWIVAVCLTALSPGGLSQSADLCKRVKVQSSGDHIMIALWGQNRDTDQTAEYLKASGANTIGWTLMEVKAGLTAAEQAFPRSSGKSAVAKTPRSTR